MELSVEQKINKAKINLILDAPFFGTLLLRFKFINVNKIKTMGIDGVSIFYNNDFINSLSIKEVTGVIAHEILHAAYQHPFRRGNRNSTKYNVACDYAINGILLNSNFILPANRLYKKEWDGKTAEQIYNLLPDDGSNNKDADWGKVLDAPKQSDNSLCGKTQKELSCELKIATQMAAMVARKKGSLPGGLEFFLKNLLEPKISWKEILRKFVETNAKNDYTWLQPSKRYISSGIYLPSIKSEKINLIIAIDTSSSVKENELKQFLSEINCIAKELQVDAHVLCCDTKIISVQEFTSYDEINISLKGRGGTEFKPVFNYVEENNLTPNCLIYFTDMRCLFTGITFPDYPVLWVQTGNSKVNPPFGEIIKL